MRFHHFTRRMTEPSFFVAQARRSHCDPWLSRHAHTQVPHTHVLGPVSRCEHAAGEDRTGLLQKDVNVMMIAMAARPAKEG
jgi:hypothetical protein